MRLCVFEHCLAPVRRQRGPSHSIASTWPTVLGRFQQRVLCVALRAPPELCQSMNRLPCQVALIFVCAWTGTSQGHGNPPACSHACALLRARSAIWTQTFESCPRPAGSTVRNSYLSSLRGLYATLSLASIEQFCARLGKLVNVRTPVRGGKHFRLRHAKRPLLGD
jgi:hypothetical protein